MSRGNVMKISKTIEIAGQTFSPERPQFAGGQPIEFATHRESVPVERLFCGVTHEDDFDRCILCSLHPAACSSSVIGAAACSSDVNPTASRPGARVPRLP